MSLLSRATHIYMGVIVPASIIIPIIPAAAKYKKLSAELKVIVWYLFLSAITNVIDPVLAFKSINNMPVYHIYTLLEFVLLAIFYRKILSGTATGRYINILIPIFILVCIINALFFQNIYTYNTYTKSVEAVIIIILAITYFKNMLDKIGGDENKNKSLVYINSGLLLYFSGSFILFIISNMIVENHLFFKLMWSIHATFMLLLYILIAVALWKDKNGEPALTRDNFIF